MQSPSSTMRCIAIILFCSAILTVAVSSQEESNDKENELLATRRQKRSMIFFPAGSSEGEEEEEDEEDQEEIDSSLFSFAINPFENPLYGLVGGNDTNIELDSLHDETIVNALRLLEEVVSEDAMERSLTGRGKQLKRKTPAHISIIGAAINALNPLTYMRGSFNGFRHALRQNIMPFKKHFGINRKDSKQTDPSTTISTTEVPKLNKPVNGKDSPEDSATNLASVTVTSPSSSQSTKNGLDLKIPAELINYAALEVNLKPNGDINIVPVTTRPLVTVSSNTLSNLKDQSNNGDGGGSGSTNNIGKRGITHVTLPTSSPYNVNSNNLNSLNNLRLLNTNNFGGGYANTNNVNSNGMVKANSFHDNVRSTQNLEVNKINTHNVVKLVTDRPVVVDSIQDIIGSNNIINKNALLKKFPIPVDFTSLYRDPSVHPEASLRFPSSVDISPDHIYLLPFRISENKNMYSPVTIPSRYRKRNMPKHDADASEIYYIDITIPEKNTLKPAVRHKRYHSQKGYRRRFRRNASEKERGTVKTNTRRNFLDYDGWQPLNRFDPMSEEPTLIYKPPTLERVHFGKDPPKERPLYPVLPVNPPVYVIRAEPAEKEIHAIYGTENINYLHLNPKTQQAKAYSAFGKNRFFERNSIPKHIPPKSEKSNSSSFSLSDILKSFVHNNVQNLNPASNSTDNETGEDIIASNKNNIISETINEEKIIVENIQENTTPAPSPTTPTTTSTTPTTTYTTPTATSTTTTPITTTYTHTTTSPSTTTTTTSPPPPPPTTSTTATTTSNNNNNNTPSENIYNTKLNNTINLNSSNNNQMQSPVNNEEENEILNSQFSVKSLAIDDDYYYVYEDEVDTNPDYEFQIESKVAKSDHDPFASIIPKVSNAHSYKDLISSYPEVDEGKEDERDPYYAEASETVEQRVSTRAPLHQLLRNFDGVQYDQYIFSASENREKELTAKNPQTVSRSRLTIPFKPQIATGRKISSPVLGVNSRDWYLIDTRSKPKKEIDPRWKNSFDERDYFFDRSTSKYSESQNLYKSFSENKLNAFKPHESLTANSLSELLQIFKYVTTPSPIQRFSDFNAYQNKRKTFRYTKPTEPPNRAKYFTTFRYTVPVTRLVETTESNPDVDVHGVNDPSKIINDTVAETNSLDGYLFSDSINAPKYTRPEGQTNVVKISEKRATNRKPSKASKKEPNVDNKSFQRSETTTKEPKMDKDAIQRGGMSNKESKMDRDAVQRGDIAPPFVIEIKESDMRPFSLPESYLIHQGHSRVKVYGLNSDPNAKLEFTTQRSKSTTLDHILMTPQSLSSSSTVVTTAPTTTSTTSKVIRKRQIKHAKSLASSEFLERIDTDKLVTVSKDIPRWTRQSSEDRLKENENGENIPSPFKIFSDLFTKFIR